MTTNDAVFPSNPPKKEPASLTLTESDLGHFGVASMQKHCSESELARRWGFSENTIRRLSKWEPGVIRIVHEATRESAATQAFASRNGSPSAFTRGFSRSLDQEFRQECQKYWYTSDRGSMNAPERTNPGRDNETSGRNAPFHKVVAAPWKSRRHRPSTFPAR